MRMFHRKRPVRLHFVDDAKASLDGIYVADEAGHYVLAKASAVSGDGEDPVEMVGEVWVPREKVLMLQVTR